MCSTEVDEAGLEKFYNWGWCGEGCPLEGLDESTWASDDTLSVEALRVEELDTDLYRAVIVVLALVTSIPIIGIAFKIFGISSNF